MKKSLKKLYPSLGSVFLFFLLFMYGLVKNMSMSYMGNTSEQMKEYILNNFLGFIVFFLLKILAVYLIIGFILGIIIYIFIISFFGILKKELSLNKNLLINFFVSGFIFLVFFFKDLIRYPQLYINYFYVKNDINKFLLDFLSDNINPLVFTFIQVIIAALIIGAVLLYVFKNKKSLFKYLVYSLSVLIIISGIISIFKSKPGKFNKPNILILASDALRPDHFSGYGYFRNTTPNIDRLINEGVSFRNTFIEVPRTFPSWVSILTGRFSSSHGIRHMFPTSRDLNRDFKSIVKILKRTGYETSVIADYAGDIFSRIELGFDKVDTPYFNADYMLEQIILETHTGLFPFITGKIGLKIFPVLKDSAYFCPPEFVKDKVINSIRESKRPFFIATFFSSTHFPYSSPYPYYKIYAEKDYSGPYKYYKQQIISLDNKEAAVISNKDISQIRSLYDGGLKAFDDAVGDILTYLSENDILDNTIIIILSDHGENLYEDNLGMGHGEHFRGGYAIKIPFIIRYPALGLMKKEIYNVVRHIDLAPTILSILDEPVPGYMEGSSLLPLIKGERFKDLYAYGETGIWFDNSVKEGLFFQKLRIMYPDITFLGEMDPNFDRQIVLKDDYRDLINLAKHRYVFDGRYKLIYMPLKDKIMYELYDKLNDPEERENIASADDYNLHRLKKTLFDWIKRNNDVIVRKEFIFPILRY